MIGKVQKFEYHPNQEGENAEDKDDYTHDNGR